MTTPMHCWHNTDTTVNFIKSHADHAVPYERICCHCGETRFDTFTVHDIRGHGAFLPGARTQKIFRFDHYGECSKAPTERPAAPTHD